MKRTFAAGSATPTFIKALVFLTASVVFAIAAQTTGPSSYDNTRGDFILGFRKVNTTTDVLVDIGPIADFTTAQTFGLGALGGVLSSTLGSDYATNANVFFSLAATSRPQDGSSPVNYVTSAEYPSSGTPAKVWTRLTNNNSFTLQNKIINCGLDFNNFTVQSGTTAVKEQSSSPDAYQNFMPGGTMDTGHAGQANISWALFNPTTEGSFKSGTSGVVLHLIQLIPGSGPGTDLGTFVLSADFSTLTFTPKSSVSPTPTPTPSPTPTPTPGPTPTPTPTPTPGPTPEPTPTPTPTPTPEPTATPSPSPEPSPSPSPEPSPSPSPSPSPTPGHPTFFKGEVPLKNSVYYLTFPNGNLFGYYAYLTDQNYLYHFDMGYEYIFDAADGQGGVYLYDFASQTFFYTSPTFPFPYLYDFTLNAVIYYYPDVPADGRYTHNPRYFYDVTHGTIITK